MNREALKERINSLPLFDQRAVKVATTTKGDEFEDVGYNKAVCEIGHTRPYAFTAGNRYALLQFKELFDPLIDSIEGDLDGHLINYDGKAALTVFPNDERLKDGSHKYGLVAVNSVDMSTSVIVKFCVKTGGRTITIPAKVGGLKKQHSKKVGSIVKDYMNMIGPVKSAWMKIVKEFPKIIIKDNCEGETRMCLTFAEAVHNFKLGERMEKSLRTNYDCFTSDYPDKDFNLWQLFIGSLDEIASKNYKSQYHRQTRVDKLCEAIFKYATMLSI